MSDDVKSDEVLPGVTAEEAVTGLDPSALVGPDDPRDPRGSGVGPVSTHLLTPSHPSGAADPVEVDDALPPGDPALRR